MMQVKCKVFSMVLSLSLAVGLCPGIAVADTLTASPPEALVQQANTKTVYVISSVKTATSYDLGILGTTQSSTTESYAYNAKGLVKSHTNKVGSVSAKTSLAYSGNKIKSAKLTGGGATANASYVYAPNGRISLATTLNSIVAGGVAASTVGTVTPTYKSGRISKLTSVDQATANGQTADSTITTTYAYKSGRVSKAVSSLGVTRVYAYDKRGNISKVGSVKYKNSYGKGRLSKTVFSSNGGKTTRTYKYKAVKVPSSVVKLVEDQQWAIANENLNFAFGIAATY